MSGNPPDRQPLIELRGVTKVYGTGQAAMPALRGVDLRIEEGEFVAVMGPSGSGKSTVMNILGCLDTPTAGEYLFRDIHVEQLSRDQRALLRRKYVGFVFQGFNLLPKLTALDNVALPLMYAGMGREARRRQAQAMLDRVGLGERSHHTPLQLSGGQQQRVAIARALATRPRIIFADEPTGNLDSETSRQVMALFRELNRGEGITLVLVTHETDIAAYARRRIRFQDGRVIEDVVQEQAEVAA
jgi:putative ABC transport system ATP-binding protein